MVPSRCVKSEYMKRFKEPKWEACGPCYQELLRYRLSRRLLEQAHRPWFWDGWEQDSSLSSGGSGSAGSPSPPGTSSPPGAQQGEEEAAVTSVAAEVPGESVQGRISGSGEPGRSSPAEPLRGSEPEDDDQEKADVKEVEGKSAGKGSDNRASRQQGRPPSRSALGSRGDRRPARSPQRTETTKGTKHPFALYGWGEKQTDTGSQKTHNVCASASVNEIHESALRAKNRRQMEKRMLSRRLIHSAEVERTWRTKPSGPDNPWMTEYMRCYSARAR